MLKTWKKLTTLFRKIETGTLIFLLSLIVLVSGSQIILRNFFQAIDWFDPLLKYAVLWIGMIAAGIATYENKHIKIDIVGRLVKGRKKSIVYAVTNIFASIFSLILFFTFLLYIIKIEYPSSDPPPFLGIKRWILLLILPVSFFTMFVRFLESSVRNVYNFAKNIPEIDNETIGLEKEGEDK